jgi:hypothetical protein
MEMWSGNGSRSARTPERSDVMESYDPRRPIIKATEDEIDEVHGHALIDSEPPHGCSRRVIEGNGVDEVAGHLLTALNPEQGASEPLHATEDASEDGDGVEGHRFSGCQAPMPETATAPAVMDSTGGGRP